MEHIPFYKGDEYDSHRARNDAHSQPCSLGFQCVCAVGVAQKVLAQARKRAVWPGPITLADAPKCAHAGRCETCMTSTPKSKQLKPSAAHQRLKVFIGDWHAEGTCCGDRQDAAYPGAAGVLWTSDESCEWLPGSFFVLHRWDVQMRFPNTEIVTVGRAQIVEVKAPPRLGPVVQGTGRWLCEHAIGGTTP